MILIVDDDMSVRQSIGLLLSRAGYECDEASTEEEALAKVRSLQPELLVLDMNLRLESSGRQGIEMLRKVKILCPEMSVILITAWGTISLAVEGMKYGASDFVTKPWLNADLLKSVRKGLEEARQKLAQTNQVATLEDLERESIIKVVKMCDNNYTHAAKLLGITRQALYRRLEKYGLIK